MFLNSIFEPSDWRQILPGVSQHSVAVFWTSSFTFNSSFGPFMAISYWFQPSFAGFSLEGWSLRVWRPLVLSVATFMGNLSMFQNVACVVECALGFDRSRPDLVFADHAEKYAAVAFAEVAPLEAEDVVGVVVFGADVTAGAAGVGHDAVVGAPDVLEFVTGKRSSR